MGDHKDRGTQIVDLLKQGHDLEGAGRVQVAGGLVGDDGRGVIHQGTGNGQTLLLAAGHLSGVTVRLVLQAYQLQHIGNTVPDLPLPGTDHTHGEGHVVIDRHIVDQAEVLKHNADGTPQQRDLPLANALQRIAIDLHGAGGRPEFTGNELDDGGFSGSGRANQEAELAVVDLHGHAVQRFIALLVAFYDICKFNHLHVSPVEVSAFFERPGSLPLPILCAQCIRIVTQNGRKVNDVPRKRRESLIF